MAQVLLAVIVSNYFDMVTDDVRPLLGLLVIAWFSSSESAANLFSLIICATYYLTCRFRRTAWKGRNTQGPKRTCIFSSPHILHSAEKVNFEFVFCIGFRWTIPQAPTIPRTVRERPLLTAGGGVGHLTPENDLKKFNPPSGNAQEKNNPPYTKG